MDLLKRMSFTPGGTAAEAEEGEDDNIILRRNNINNNSIRMTRDDDYYNSSSSMTGSGNGGGVDVKTTLAGPAMSVATFAALNSLNSYVGGNAVSDVCGATSTVTGGSSATTGIAIAATAAAAAAASEGVKYYNDRYLTQKSLEQNKAIHEIETNIATKHHHAALDLESRLHNQDLQREAEQHLQDMTNQLREGQKEADRDLWEQQNTEKQSSMTVSALLLGCGFVLAVEGTLPSTSNTKSLWLFPNLDLVNVYYFCVAMSVALLLISVMASQNVLKRMARFMLSRTAKQQETLKKLRELANKQLRELQREDDNNNILGTNNNNNNTNSSIKIGSEVRVHRKGSPKGIGVIRYMKQQIPPRNNNDNNNKPSTIRRGKMDHHHHQHPSCSSSTTFDVEYPDTGRYEYNTPLEEIELISIQERLQKARHQFSQHLWEQPVLVMDWRPVGSGRHVVSFQEWYYYDKVSLISQINILAFKVGALFLIFALGLYVEAILRYNNDEEGEENDNNNNHACIIFWFVLLSIALSLFAYLEFVEIMYPTPHWRDEFRTTTTKWTAAGTSSRTTTTTTTKSSNILNGMFNNYEQQHSTTPNNNNNNKNNNNNHLEVGARVRVKRSASGNMEGRCLRLISRKKIKTATIHNSGSSNFNNVAFAPDLSSKRPLNNNDLNNPLFKEEDDDQQRSNLFLTTTTNNQNNDNKSSSRSERIFTIAEGSGMVEENQNNNQYGGDDDDDHNEVYSDFLNDLESQQPPERKGRSSALPSSPPVRPEAVTNENISTENETGSSASRAMVEGEYREKEEEDDDDEEEPSHWVVILNDTREIKLFKQDELQQIKDPSSLSGGKYQHKKLVYQSSLEMVNIEVIKFKQQELFEAIDTGGTGRVSIEEICNCLGFDLPPTDNGAKNDNNDDAQKYSPTTIFGTLMDGRKEQKRRRTTIHTSSDRIIRSQQIKARTILRENSILQEAVVKLLERLVRRQYHYIILEQKNLRKAHMYLRKVRKHAADALLCIDNGEDQRQLLYYDDDDDEEDWDYSSSGGGALRTGSSDKINHDKPSMMGRRSLTCKFPYLKTGEGISKHEWDQIMTGIFHDKFF